MSEISGGQKGILSLAVVIVFCGLVGSFVRDPDLTGGGFLYETARRVCEATHPVETWAAVRSEQFQKPHVCEQQHVIQQQDDLCRTDIVECHKRTVYWARSLHSFTDRAGHKPFAEDQPTVIAFTNDNEYNLKTAYKMGAYGMQWHTVFLGYTSNTKTSFVPLEFDGMSNIVYFWAWLVNTPQNFVNQTAYVIRIQRYDLLIDVVLGVVIFAFDLALAGVSTAIGVIAGTALSPLDTVLAVPGGAWLLIESTWTGCAELVMGIFRLFTAVMGL